MFREAGGGSLCREELDEVHGDGQAPQLHGAEGQGDHVGGHRAARGHLRGTGRESEAHEQVCKCRGP